MDDVFEAKPLLQGLLLFIRTRLQHRINVLNDPSHIRAAVCRHPQPDGAEVLPKVAHSLDNRAGRMVCPKRPRRLSLRPSRERTAVRPPGENPWRIRRRARSVRIKRQLHIRGEIRRIQNRILKRVIAQVPRGQLLDRRASAPVSVLKHDDRAAHGLGKRARDGLVGQVARVPVGGGLAWREEDDGGAGPGVELVAPPEALRERAKTGVRVVDLLLEYALPGHPLPQMAPAVVGQGWWDKPGPGAEDRGTDGAGEEETCGYPAGGGEEAHFGL